MKDEFLPARPPSSSKQQNHKLSKMHHRKYVVVFVSPEKVLWICTILDTGFWPGQRVHFPTVSILAAGLLGVWGHPTLYFSSRAVGEGLLLWWCGVLYIQWGHTEWQVLCVHSSWLSCYTLLAYSYSLGYWL